MSGITLAVDGSEHSMTAAGVAGSLARALGTTVDVINVVSEVPTSVAGALTEYSVVEHMVIGQRELLQAAGTAVVARAIGKVREAGGEIRTSDVLIGSPPHEIARYAENTGADWVVMGRRGLGEVKGVMLGSVANKVSQLTDKTLVTTEDRAPDWSQILLAVDGSEHAERAAYLAGKISHTLGSQVDVLTVISDGELHRPGLHGYVEDYNLLQDLFETRRAELMAQGSRIVTNASRELEEAGGSVRYEDVLIGDPATEIEATARTYKSGAIVMGRRGLGDIKGLLLGSVSHKVAHLTNKTLVTVE